MYRSRRPKATSGTVVKYVVSVFYPLAVATVTRAPIGVWCSPELSDIVPTDLLDDLNQKWGHRLDIKKSKVDKGIRIETALQYPTQRSLHQTARRLEQDLRRRLSRFGVHVSTTPVKTEKEWKKAIA